MYGTIGFEDHQVDCIIGAEPEERHEEQAIYVDLQVEYDFSKCVKSDAIQDAVDYVALTDLCTQVAQKGKFYLIEAYAHTCLEQLLDHFPLRKAHIVVKKPKGLPSAKHAIVSLSKERK